MFLSRPDQVTFKKGKRSERILNRLRERSTSLVRLNAENQRQKYIVEKLIKREHKKQLPVVDEVLWSGIKCTSLLKTNPVVIHSCLFFLLFEKHNLILFLFFPHPSSPRWYWWPESTKTKGRSYNLPLYVLPKNCFLLVVISHVHAVI